MPLRLAVVPELDSELGRLYGLPLDEFTAARNELATRLRRAGQTDAAERVRALRKPSVAVWAVNRLARTHPDELEELLEAGRGLRDAQAKALRGTGADAVREATAAERTALRNLTAGRASAEGRASPRERGDARTCRSDAAGRRGGSRRRRPPGGGTPAGRGRIVGVRRPRSHGAASIHAEGRAFETRAAEGAEGEPRPDQEAPGARNAARRTRGGPGRASGPRRRGRPGGAGARGPGTGRGRRGLARAARCEPRCQRINRALPGETRLVAGGDDIIILDGCTFWYSDANGDL